MKNLLTIIKNDNKSYENDKIDIAISNMYAMMEE